MGGLQCCRSAIDAAVASRREINDNTQYRTSAQPAKHTANLVPSTAAKITHSSNKDLIRSTAPLLQCGSASDKHASGIPDCQCRVLLLSPSWLQAGPLLLLTPAGSGKHRGQQQRPGERGHSKASTGQPTHTPARLYVLCSCRCCWVLAEVGCLQNGDGQPARAGPPWRGCAISHTGYCACSTTS